MLNIGTWRSSGVERLLRFAWANGVRYIDTAKSYGTEPAIGRWLQADPRGTQGAVPGHQGPSPSPQRTDRQLDQRLAALKTDYVDLIFIHALGDHDFATEVKWPSEPGIQGGRRGDPQVGQGEVRRVLDAPPAPAGDPPGRREGRVR